MSRRLPLTIALIAFVGAQPAIAIPKKPVAKSAFKKSKAKPAVDKTASLPVEPTKPGGFMTPKAVLLRAVTPAEAEANAVWNVRAALNIAALQCQFSPFLATVANYNDLLKHHGDELARAQSTMLGHFKRYDGARAANSFDQYTTKTYNSYSTLDAQYRFCEAAGLVGRQALTIAKNKLGTVAIGLNAETRAALGESPLSPALAVTPVAPVAIAPIVDPDA